MKLKHIKTYQQLNEATQNLAPNGKPSNLNPNQYKLVRTKEFISWFGDWINSPETASKVVDKNGEPLVVYHGTGAEFYVFDKTIFGKFGKGMYFTSFFDDANKYAKRAGSSRVIPVFLNSPKIFKTEKPYLSQIDNLPSDYDGIWSFKGEKEIEEIVVYSPEQIKLADGRNTTFNPKSPKINESDENIKFPDVWYHGTNEDFDEFTG